VLGALAIAAGYISLVWVFGWKGAVAAALHAAVMLLAMKR
jgi:glucose-6-phosphate-specific signal transduction histidine kinase